MLVKECIKYLGLKLTLSKEKRHPSTSLIVLVITLMLITCLFPSCLAHSTPPPRKNIEIFQGYSYKKL